MESSQNMDNVIFSSMLLRQMELVQTFSLNGFHTCAPIIFGNLQITASTSQHQNDKPCDIILEPMLKFVDELPLCESAKVLSHELMSSISGFFANRTLSMAQSAEGDTLVLFNSDIQIEIVALRDEDILLTHLVMGMGTLNAYNAMYTDMSGVAYNIGGVTSDNAVTESVNFDWDLLPESLAGIHGHAIDSGYFTEFTEGLYTVRNPENNNVVTFGF